MFYLIVFVVELYNGSPSCVFNVLDVFVWHGLMQII